MNPASPQFSVAILPTAIRSGTIAGCDVVVTDILRATSTIIAALANGAERVIPVPEIPAGIELKQRLGPSTLLGGERKGVIIPGYDHGNSPREFTPEAIAGKTLVLCTTNGTVAMESARSAARILIGAFINLSAVADQLRSSTRVTVICSGTDRMVTSEDILFAGALAATLGHAPDSPALDDAARIARVWWQAAASQIQSGATTLENQFRLSHGGRNLVKLGYDEDIRFCATIDRVPVVPLLDQGAWVIRLASNAADPA